MSERVWLTCYHLSHALLVSLSLSLYPLDPSLVLCISLSIAFSFLVSCFVAPIERGLIFPITASLLSHRTTYMPLTDFTYTHKLTSGRELLALIYNTQQIDLHKCTLYLVSSSIHAFARSIIWFTCISNISILRQHLHQQQHQHQR